MRDRHKNPDIAALIRAMLAYVQRGAWAVLGDPGKEAVEVVTGGGLERNPHAQGTYENA